MTITGEIRAARPRRPRPRRWRITSLEVLCAVLLLALVLQGWLVRVLDVPGLRTGATVFVAVCVQAMPFLVFGVLISGAIAAFVPASALRRVLPGRTALAVPVAGIAGVALPGCECASVPVARRLMQQGVAPAVALAFLLAAPAVNPVVLVATAVAFPGEPGMVLARFLGSLLTAVVMGWLWTRLGRAEWIAERALRRLPDGDGTPRWLVFAETARHDLVEAGGFLVLGGLTSAALNVLVPGELLASLGGQLVLGVLVMALLAVVLALCSEADAFVAASLSALPLLPRLVFLVVGPAVDVKLIALQAGTFGRAFAARFAPATFVVAVCCALVSGVLVLGGVR
ncbi:permease [Goodfellowiella coeruleoviolacea]|uniref:permease n=1 Tax=Goodfellowiella coeruleoviolacea TaxID=334858 RepID=UPI0020A5DA01|nr:permease [Goodfellowiella coeruleoviolacea]